jgi:hypothetical protein
LERVVRERNRHPRPGNGSARLFALLMCLVLGVAGTAVARSGALGDPGPPPPAGSAAQPPPACGTAACPTVAGPVGGLGAVGALSGEPGPRPLFPGLPGALRRATAPGQIKPAGSPAEGRGVKDEQPHGKAKGHGSEHSPQGPGVPSLGASSRSGAPSSGGGHRGGSADHSSGGHRSSGHGRGHSRGGGRSGGPRGAGRTGGSGGGASQGQAGGASGEGGASNAHAGGSGR